MDMHMEFGSLASWIIIGLTIIGLHAGVFWRLMGRINKVDEMRSGDVKALWQGIAEIKDNYVRRDDLAAHMQRFEKGQEDLAKSIDRLRDWLDNVLRELLRMLPDAQRKGEDHGD